MLSRLSSCSVVLTKIIQKYYWYERSKCYLASWAILRQITTLTNNTLNDCRNCFQMCFEIREQVYSIVPTFSINTTLPDWFFPNFIFYEARQINVDKLVNVSKDLVKFTKFSGNIFLKPKTMVQGKWNIIELYHLKTRFR